MHFSALTARRSFNDSLPSDVRFLSLMMFSFEKVRSSLPLETGKEKSSVASFNALDHSDELGAWNNRHQTDW